MSNRTISLYRIDEAHLSLIFGPSGGLSSARFSHGNAKPRDVTSLLRYLREDAYIETLARLGFFLHPPSRSPGVIKAQEMLRGLGLVLVEGWTTHRDSESFFRGHVCCAVEGDEDPIHLILVGAVKIDPLSGGLIEFQVQGTGNEVLSH